jgi:hypothetical protein
MAGGLGRTVSGTPTLGWTPPRGMATTPDQLPPEAGRALTLFEDERLIRCWRTARGYLVLTNLRVGVVWPVPELLRKASWEEGPQYFFYNLRRPTVLLGRFVELKEAYDEQGRSTRFLVSEPEVVADEIAAQIGPGRAEWDARRETTRRQMETRRRVRAARTGGGPAGAGALTYPYPCQFCGNPIPIGARQCPSCGAPVS